MSHIIITYIYIYIYIHIIIDTRESHTDCYGPFFTQSLHFCDTNDLRPTRSRKDRTQLNRPVSLSQ